MARYITLVNWTDQGVRNYRDTVDRAGQFEELVQKMGGRVVDLVWTLGPHDLVATVEGPDDETATAISLAISSLGNVRTTTMRAFTRDEMTEIVRRTG